MTEPYKRYLDTSYLSGGNATYVEDQYEAYLQDPTSVSEALRAYFDALQNVPAADGSNARDIPHTPIIISFVERAKHGPIRTIITSADSDVGRKHVAAMQLMAAYRSMGLRWADLDPLKRQERPPVSDLDPAFHRFTEADQDIVFNASNTYFSRESMSLRELINNLRETYCDSVGAEFMYISDQAQKRWWQERLKIIRSEPTFSAEKKKHILERLTAAEGLERFLHTKYVGRRRFSLEDGESFIAAVDELTQHSGAKGVQEIMIGIAHRDRLDVSVNTLGKMPADLFAEFEGKHVNNLPAGGVKYHKGLPSDMTTPGSPIHLSLAFDPSHPEIVDLVVEGSVKTRQERHGDKHGAQVLTVQVHGGAAFASQGVVVRTLNLAQARGYGTGDTIHIVINNQIGLATSDPHDSRSTLYCTNVVEMIEVPVLHMNGDDPEVVVLVMQLAVNFHTELQKDIVVSIVCSRKLDHNEQDTPAMTRPLMYKKIGTHPGTRKLHADKLVTQKTLKPEEPDVLVQEFRAAMNAGEHTVDPILSNFKNKFAVDWLPFLNRKWTDSANTMVPMAELKRLAERITVIPDHFKLYPLVEDVVSSRAKMGKGEVLLDWGMGEHLAFASLVVSGYLVHITGQDTGRGMLTHRHAVLHDQSRERWDVGSYISLQNVSESQTPFTVTDPMLSEEAVMGSEYGYSSAGPNALVIWGAQFGDFANDAQVVIDQFVSSGEMKWSRASGLTLMLPHDYEGQGPEHSSAHLGHYLQLCTDHNMQVVQPTTPAQIFHLLRHQMIRMFRGPLIILTPKSLLHNKDAVSPLSGLAKGHFETVIAGTVEDLNTAKVRRVVACSGKVYYGLVDARKECGLTDTAIIRVEQLYPFPRKSFAAKLRKYPNLAEAVWCQDEPQDQGTQFFVWHYVLGNMTKGQKLGYAGRPTSASPAVGYYAKHNEQQKTLIDTTFNKLKDSVLNK